MFPREAPPNPALIIVNELLTAGVSAPSDAVKEQAPVVTVMLTFVVVNTPATAEPLTVPFNVMLVQVPPVFARVTVLVSLVHVVPPESLTAT